MYTFAPSPAQSTKLYAPPQIVIGSETAEPPHLGALLPTLAMTAPNFSDLGVKALLFDVFGTVVDWQGSVHRLLEKRAKSEGIGKSRF